MLTNGHGQRQEPGTESSVPLEDATWEGCHVRQVTT